MPVSVQPVFSLPGSLTSPEHEPIDILIRTEEVKFSVEAAADVAKKNRLGFEAKYGLGQFSSVQVASNETGSNRQSLYNQHDRELKKIIQKLKKAELD